MESTVTPWVVNSTYRNDTESLRELIAPPWVPSPNARGTIDILQSCIITLIACIYTALHLNVPNNTNLVPTVKRQTRWAAMSLFAPEIVLYMALDQFRQAIKLKYRLRRLQSQGKVSEDLDISLKYAFFVIMGGVHIDITDIVSGHDLEENGQMKGRKVGMKKHSEDSVESYSARLTPKCIVRLAEAGALPEISSEEIEDKSKSNYLQKGLVIMQVAWMVIQCITRKVIGLPLTLLEIHTMVHVGCTIILYICWLEKPLDVKVPKFIDMSKLEQGKDAKKFTQIKGEIALAVQQLFYSHMMKNLSIFDPKTLTVHDSTVQRESLVLDGVIMASAACGLRIDHLNYELKIEPRFLERWERIFAAFNFDRLSVPHNAPSGTLEPEDYKGLLNPQSDDQAEKAITAIPLHTLEMFTAYELKPRALLLSGGEKNLDVHFFNRDASRLWGSAIDFIRNNSVLGILVTVLSAIYGGIHLLAWNRNFPTDIESWAWKISSIVIVAAFPIWYLGSVMTNAIASNVIWVRKPHFIAQVVGTLASWLLWPQMAIYAVARIFIVAEAFANLRHIPIGAYLTPNWTQLLPHLGR